MNVRRGFTAEEAARRAAATLRGPSQPIIDTLARYEQDGRIEYLIASCPHAAGGHSIERFAAEVMPALRQVAVSR